MAPSFRDSYLSCLRDPAIRDTLRGIFDEGVKALQLDLDLDLDLDLVSNRQTSSVEYHADGGSAARYGESFASRCLKLSADGQLTASAERRFQSGIVRG